MCLISNFTIMKIVYVWEKNIFLKKLNFWAELNLTIVLIPSRLMLIWAKIDFSAQSWLSYDTTRPGPGCPGAVLEAHSFKEDHTAPLWRVQWADSLQLQCLWGPSTLQAKASLFLRSPQAMIEYSGGLWLAISLFLFFKKYSSIWLPRVLVTSYRLFHCNTRAP